MNLSCACPTVLLIIACLSSLGSSVFTKDKV
nr:MAG TPA: hypothetical protein [Caudoviricetes sp.]